MDNKTPRGQKELECLQAAVRLISPNDPTRVYLSSAKSNLKPNDFPDFVFDGGFIEHFQVTSAKETLRKGDEHRIAESQFEKDSQEHFDRVKQEYLNSTPSPGTLTTDILEMNSQEHSYEYFVESFKRNFEKHLESLDKYDGDKTNGIFLIEHKSARITILRGGKFVGFYLIKCDKDLLSYLNGYSDKLKYLIYFCGDSYEVIEFCKIPKILKTIPTGISFGVGRYINQNINFLLDI